MPTRDFECEQCGRVVKDVLIRQGHEQDDEAEQRCCEQLMRRKVGGFARYGIMGDNGASRTPAGQGFSGGE